MKTLWKVLAAVQLTVVIPGLAVAAHAGETVYFAYKAKELEDRVSRTMLLERMDEVAQDSCKNVTFYTTRLAVERCAKDIRDQFIDAIDDEALSLLAESGPA